MTPEAQARGAAVAAVRRSAPSSWLDRSFYDRCITRGVLGSIMPVIYGNGNMIFQAPGYVTIIFALGFLSSVNLAMIGVLGVYIGRIHEEVRARPTYLVARNRVRG